MTVQDQRNMLYFAAVSGPQPWSCFFCGGPVEIAQKCPGQGGGKYTPVLHHVDGNHENDELSNWAWAHNSCHTSHHRAGTPLSDHHKASISAGHRRRQKVRGAGVEPAGG